jgi:type I restriction enzyme S subunit
MKNLETLIQELCPDGVEFVKLGDVCEIKGRIGFRGYTRKDLVSESEGAITLSPSNIINGNIVYDKCSYISWAKYEESPEIMAEVGDVVFTKTASVGKTAYIENMPKEMTINPQLVLLKKFRGVSKYLAYILKTTYFQNEVKKITGVGSVPNVPQSSLAKIEIPLPPIEVQTEIVRILDKFTSLEAELEAELDCRKRQYEYYRDKLLSFDNVGGGQEVTISKIGDIGRICMCKRIMKNQTNSESGIPFYKIGTFGKVADAYISNDVYEEYKKLYSYPKKGDILMSASGTIGRTVVFNGKPSYFQDSNIVWVDNDETKVFNSYLNYYYQIIEWKTQGGTIKRLYNNLLAGATIKYPSLEEQHRIVSILNRFESLTTSLQSGLPAEIVARRQQYEHYRDKLLTFKRKGAA